MGKVQCKLSHNIKEEAHTLEVLSWCFGPSLNCTPSNGVGLEYQKEKQQLKKMRDLLIYSQASTVEKTFGWILVENRKTASNYKKYQKQVSVKRGKFISSGILFR